MAEIKLTRRVKYAGDIVNGLIDAGWDFERAIHFVCNLPDAKPERPKGRWVLDEQTGVISCPYCKHLTAIVWNNRLYEDAIYEHNFCSFCGADMRGESE